MNRTFENSRGRRFHSGAGGTYPINDGDPQNDFEDELDDDDIITAETSEPDHQGDDDNEDD